MISDRPLIGLLFVFAFCLLAPLGDALVKVVGMGAPLMVLLLSRFVFQAVSLAPVVLLSGREFPTDRRIFGLICLRSLFHILGIGMMFTGSLSNSRPFSRSTMSAFRTKGESGAP